MLEPEDSRKPILSFFWDEQDPIVPHPNEFRISSPLAYLRNRFSKIVTPGGGFQQSPSSTPLSPRSSSVLLTNLHAQPSTPPESETRGACLSFWEGIDSDFDIAEAFQRKPFADFIMQGIIFRPILAIVIVSFFFTLLLMVDIPVTSQKQLKVLSLEDFIYKDLQPTLLSIKWTQTGDHLTWVKKVNQSNVVITGYNTTTNEERILVSAAELSQILKRRVKIFEYSLSFDARYVLLAVDVDMVWDGFFYANYLIFDITLKTCSWLDQYRETPLIANAQWSPINYKIAFTSENDIWLYDMISSNYHRITFDGSYPNILNGRMCWIYQHEIFHDHNAIWWAPDGKKFAFLRNDESLVRSVPIHTYHDDYTGSIQIKYPLVNTVNPSVDIGIYNIEYDSKQFLPYDKEYVTAVMWVSDQKLLYRSMNRIQDKEFITVYYFYNDTSFTFVSQEEDPWVVIKGIKYLGNSELAMIKNNSGYYHIEVIDLRNGEKIRSLTQGNWDVMQIVGWNSTTRLLYYLSNEKHTMERHLYSVLVPTTDVQDEGNISPSSNMRVSEKAMLTEGIGYYSASFSRNCKYFLLMFEGPDLPRAILYLTSEEKTGSPKQIFLLEDNDAFKNKIGAYVLAEKIYITVPSHDPDVLLNAQILIPPHLDPNKSYGLLVHADGTPGSQTVLYKWSFGFDEYIASTLGLVVVRVDTTGTGGRGNAFMFKTFLQLGALSQKDYVSATKYLLKNIINTNLKIDPARVGIWGSNIGGYAALSSLIHNGDLFKAGIILDPITDWTLYNSVFTERHMRRPETNFEGYNATKLLNFISLLHEANFLLIHGTEYNEVYSQNAAKLKKMLALAGLQYQTISCADWPEDDKAHFYKLVITFLTAALGPK